MGMKATEIHPRSHAARVMRESLMHAEWLQGESEAMGKTLSWDAAVIAGSCIHSAMLADEALYATADDDEEEAE